MADLKTLTVAKLRELARKHLGPGYTKLKKSELIAALVKVAPKAIKAKAAQKPSPPPAPEAAPKAAAATKAKPAQKPSPPAPAGKPSEAAASKAVVRRPVPVPAPEEPAAQPLPVAAQRASASPDHAEPGIPAHRRAPASAPPPGEERRPSRNRHQPPLEPLIEGFFIARMAGEREARRHHMTEDQLAAWAHQGSGERGELPTSYGLTRPVLLPRDPTTLYFFWDQPPHPGRERRRLVLALFENGRRVRQMDFSLELRSFYLHGLTPGREYHVEAYEEIEGELRPVAAPSAPVRLPRAAPSGDLSVQLVRIPWSQPLSGVEQALAARAAGLRIEVLPPFEHLDLPGSLSWRGRAHWPLAERLPSPVFERIELPNLGQLPGSGGLPSSWTAAERR